MLSKKIINADALDARNESNKQVVIKRPACFHAVRVDSRVIFRKINEDGVVDTSKKGRSVTLASFMSSFHSFDEDNGFNVRENFKSDIFFFVGAQGLRTSSAIQMPSDFYLTDQESSSILKYKKGDYLITNELGINTAASKEDFDSLYFDKDNLHLFVKPEIKLVSEQKASLDEFAYN